MASIRTAVLKCTTESHTAPSLGGELADLIRALQVLLTDSYRPELHYMRGPGPKWRAKHDPAPTRMNRAVVADFMHVNAWGPYGSI